MFGLLTIAIGGLVCNELLTNEERISQMLIVSAISIAVIVAIKRMHVIEIYSRTWLRAK